MCWFETMNSSCGQFFPLLEGVRIDRPEFGRMIGWLNLLSVRLQGANTNRQPIDNAQYARLCIEQVEHFGPVKIGKWTVARKQV